MTSRDSRRLQGSRCPTSPRPTARFRLLPSHGATANGGHSPFDRTIRKNNVATATTLGELAMITRDLAAAPAQPTYDEPAVAPVAEPAADAYDEPVVAVGGEPAAPSFEQPAQQQPNGEPARP